MKLGAERNKVAILAALLAVAAYLMYTNVIAPQGEETTAAAAPVAKPAIPALPGNLNVGTSAGLGENLPVQAENEGEGPRTARAGEGGTQEFRPSLRPREGKDRLDPAKIDPTLELYRLDRLKEVAVSAGGRNVFEFGVAAPPPVPDVKILPTKATFGPPVPPPPAPPKVDPGPPPAPPAPPIPLKFYGFQQKSPQASRPSSVNNNAPRRGLFLRGGEEIFVANEGDLIDKRYKVIRIQATSATLEDTQFSKQQTIQIEMAPDQDSK